MDLGFETIGNATLICHDKGPRLVTDPWISGAAYFGSWTRSHTIPAHQREAITAAPYVWLSHGHPDHLSPDSLEHLRRSTLLVPDHVGGRIRRDLVAQRYTVQVMPDRTWIQLSPRIRVACAADWNQDAVLLVEMNGRLVVNLNDAGERGWGSFVRRTIRRHPESYMMRLSGYGDADMINLLDEEGRRIPPEAAARVPVGAGITRMVDDYGVRFFIPFSSMHRYQRSDSMWANAYTTGLDDYGRGFASRTCELLPAFVRVDLARDMVERIDPAPEPIDAIDSREFGDDWSEPLDGADEKEVEGYIRSVEHLRANFGFVSFRVGGRELRIPLARGQRTGLTFEVPRQSLMTAVRYAIFDDLLIGNFMKTTLHGGAALYPHFSPFVAKYADNGGARTRQELDAYFHAYRVRDAFGYLRDQLDARCVRPLQDNASRLMRRTLGPNSAVFRAAKEAYWGVRRVIR